ncbi:MAG: hypothetical protein ACTSRP_00750 [Candidatus Helarchaeota archaeon]
MTVIYEFFKELVEDIEPILKILPINNPTINILMQYFPIIFESNIIINDTNEQFYFIISPEHSSIKRGKNRYSSMTIISDESTFLRIIRGKSSILREFNFQNLWISNLKFSYMYRIILLGLLVQSKQKYDKRQKILKMIPVKVLKNFLTFILSDKIFKIIKLLINKFSSKLVKLLLK